MENAIIQTAALALCSEGAPVPDWVALTPAGPRLQGRDGRVWLLQDPQSIIDAFHRNRDMGLDVPIDFEHATHTKGRAGEYAPAVGWLKEMELRDGALWGRIEWNEAGRTAIASRSYRYISPGFHFHPQTSAVTQMVSAGLTNAPNFIMPALNRKGLTTETDEMDKAVLEALGLGPTASSADAVLAITKLKADHTLALNAAQTPDPSAFVPKADHQLALNRISTFEAAEAARQESAIVAAVDSAVAAGKVAPASKDFYLATCRMDGGLDRFNDLMASAPVIAPSNIAAGQKTNDAAGKLSEADLAVCRQMGMDPATFNLQE